MSAIDILGIFSTLTIGINEQARRYIWFYILFSSQLLFYMS